MNELIFTLVCLISVEYNYGFFNSRLKPKIVSTPIVQNVTDFINDLLTEKIQAGEKLIRERSVKDNLLEEIKGVIEEDSRKKILTIYNYGYLLRDNDEVNKTARKYGFRYKALAGCLVPEGLVEIIREKNKETYKKIDRRNGSGWRDRYSRDLSYDYK